MKQAMYDPPSKKKQMIRQSIIALAMTVTVVTLVFTLILMVLGYRFNRAEGTLEQGGLVQFNSIPAAATLTLDSTKLSSVTPANLTIGAGPHTITMAKSGYAPWQKNVEVKAGSVLWLTYARLIPTDLPVSNVANFPAVTSSLTSPSRKWFALTTDPAAPAITLADISTDTPKLTNLTLPAGGYTVPTDKTGEVFRLMSWDPSNRFLLIEHTYVGGSEWIMADTENIAASKNLTDLFDLPITGVRFSNSNSRILYALINGDVRRIDVDGATISAPLVKGVAEFSLYDRSIITYVTTPDPTTKQRTVGYVEDGAAKPRPIRTYSDDGASPLHLSIGKYYGDTYIAIAYGETVDILRGPLPRSDSSDPSSLTAIATMMVPGGVDFLSNKTDGRFFVAQHDANYSVYDLELDKLTSTTLKGDSPVQGELRWLDDYTAWSSRDSRLRLYEFDGANQHEIMPIIPGQNPTLSPNGRYIYAPTKDDKGAFHLSRVRLILP
jgi:hypothetical protein